MSSSVVRKLIVGYNAVLAPIVLAGVALIIAGKQLNLRHLIYLGILIVASSPLSSYIVAKKLVLPRIARRTQTRRS